MQSFGARFPRIYTDSNFEGWFVSTLLLGSFPYLPLLASTQSDMLKRHGSDPFATVPLAIASAVKRQC